MGRDVLSTSASTDSYGDAPLNGGSPPSRSGLASESAANYRGWSVREILDAIEPLALIEQSYALCRLRADVDVPEAIKRDVLLYCAVKEPGRWYEYHRFGDVQLGMLIGRGGFGATYRASGSGPLATIGAFAVKLFPVPAANRASRLAAFERETDALRTVRSPFVPSLILAELVRAGDRELAMFAIELVERAATVTDHVRALRPGLRAFLKLLIQICSGVDALHARGLVHRDLKPGNILVDRATGRPKVIDLGMAYSWGEHFRSPVFCPQAGTDLYRAPEQEEGRSDLISTATDVYALGLIFRELIPLVPEAADTRLGFGQRLDAIVNGCLQEDPARRAFQCGGDLVDEFTQLHTMLLYGATPAEADAHHVPQDRGEVSVGGLGASVSGLEVARVPRAQVSRFGPRSIASVTDLLREQDRWAARLGVPTSWKANEGVDMVLIPAGIFFAEGIVKNNPSARLPLSIQTPYYIATRVLSRSQLERFALACAAAAYPSLEMEAIMKEQSGGPDEAARLGQIDVQIMARLLSEVEGGVYRAPTEAEWILAAWAGRSDAELRDQARSGAHPLGLTVQFGKQVEWTGSRYGYDALSACTLARSPEASALVVRGGGDRLEPLAALRWRDQRRCDRRQGGIAVRLVREIDPAPNTPPGGGA